MGGNEGEGGDEREGKGERKTMIGLIKTGESLCIQTSIDKSVCVHYNIFIYLCIHEYIRKYTKYTSMHMQYWYVLHKPPSDPISRVVSLLSLKGTSCKRKEWVGGR